MMPTRSTAPCSSWAVVSLVDASSWTAMRCVSPVSSSRASRQPYSLMWRRLLAWCARHPPVKSVDDTRADAVRVLTRDFTPEVRARVTAATIRAMDAAAACVAEAHARHRCSEHQSRAVPVPVVPCVAEHRHALRPARERSTVMGSEHRTVQSVGDARDQRLEPRARLSSARCDHSVTGTSVHRAPQYLGDRGQVLQQVCVTRCGGELASQRHVQRLRVRACLVVRHHLHDDAVGHGPGIAPEYGAARAGAPLVCLLDDDERSPSPFLPAEAAFVTRRRTAFPASGRRARDGDDGAVPYRLPRLRGRRPDDYGASVAGLSRGKPRRGGAGAQQHAPGAGSPDAGRPPLLVGGPVVPVSHPPSPR